MLWQICCMKGAIKLFKQAARGTLLCLWLTIGGVAVANYERGCARCA